MAKISGEYHLLGIAQCAKHRAKMLVELLHLKQEKMLHHSTYRRILADGVNAEEIDEMSSEFLSGKKFFGKQVLVAIDGKVLRWTLDEEQRGTYLLAAYLPSEGLVLMELAVEGKGRENPAAPKMLRSIDLREKVVIGDALHTQRLVSS